MRFADVIERTGTTERQLRYLISEGFVPPPRGGRSTAEYGEDHVEAVIRYTRLKDLGFPPAAIRLLINAKTGIPVPIAPGVTLVVDAGRLASGDEIEPMVARVREELTRLLRKP